MSQPPYPYGAPQDPAYQPPADPYQPPSPYPDPTFGNPGAAQPDPGYGSPYPQQQPYPPTTPYPQSDPYQQPAAPPAGSPYSTPSYPGGGYPSSGSPAYPGSGGPAYPGGSGYPGDPTPYPGSGYPGAPGGGGYPGYNAPKKSSNGAIIAVIAALLVLVVGGGITAAVLVSGGDKKNNANGTHGTPSPSDKTDPTPSSSPDDNGGNDDNGGSDDDNNGGGVHTGDLREFLVDRPKSARKCSNEIGTNGSLSLDQAAQLSTKPDERKQTLISYGYAGGAIACWVADDASVEVRLYQFDSLNNAKRFCQDNIDGTSGGYDASNVTDVDGVPNAKSFADPKKDSNGNVSVISIGLKGDVCFVVAAIQDPPLSVSRFEKYFVDQYKKL